MESSRSKCSLLRCDEIDAVYVEPFILSGYRRPGLSWWQCIKHAFVLHNDVGNFWTHFIPFLLWVWWLVAISVSEENFFQPYNYPLLCFWFGACSYALFSSLAHMFACKSFLVHTTCFIFDYLGIAMYALGANIGSLFYVSATSSPLLQNRTWVIWTEAMVAVTGFLTCSLSRFYWKKYRFVVRVGSYAIPYFFGVGPYAHRQALCIFYGTDCVPQTFYFHMAAIVFANLLAFFFVTKIPERFFPGKFDYFFQSHQLFHVCAACLTSVQMYYTPMEMAIRRTVLIEVPGGQPTWQTTFLPFVCALMLGVGMTGCLGYLTYAGVLTTNKNDERKNK